MAIITEFKKKGKSGERYILFIDGRAFCMIDAETIVKNKLHVGDDVPEETIVEIVLTSEKNIAFEKATNYISKFIKTEKQIFDYLKGKGYPEEVCDYATNKLKEYGYLSDRHFAQNYVEIAKRSKGTRMIRYELKNKGVCEEIANEILECVDDEKENAEKICEKYLKNKEINEKNIKKAYNYLISRGFSHSNSINAIKNINKEDYDENGD